jgi:hypothetical protein
MVQSHGCTAEMSSDPDRARPNALPRWQAQTIIWAAISLTASGLFWLFVLFRRAPGDLPGGIDPWLARWHGLSSLAALFAFGVIAGQHIARGWAMRRRTFSGVSTTVLFGLLALTGYALAYLVPEQWHPQLGWLHSLLGVVAFALGAMHRR